MAFNKISFVIATVDRDRQLQECVSSIEKAHEYRKDVPVEILVVIQKARDKKKLALRHPNLTSLYYIDTLGLSHARNFAINKSTGDYFVFLDDEALVNHDFLDVLSRTT
ncbi:MAG: glycosyltransferase family A protein, partial [Candidatus Omnitrophica bacterium]|nr:glycosyltransferase family A protein [Candidatus Omnitrophota bacterium]